VRSPTRRPAGTATVPRRRSDSGRFPLGARTRRQGRRHRRGWAQAKDRRGPCCGATSAWGTLSGRCVPPPTLLHSRWPRPAVWRTATGQRRGTRSRGGTSTSCEAVRSWTARGRPVPPRRPPPATSATKRGRQHCVPPKPPERAPESAPSPTPPWRTPRYGAPPGRRGRGARPADPRSTRDSSVCASGQAAAAGKRPMLHIISDTLELSYAGDGGAPFGCPPFGLLRVASSARSPRRHPPSPDLQSTLSQWGISKVGLDYNVVAVFGSQSTGKSTRGLLRGPQSRLGAAADMPGPPFRPVLSQARCSTSSLARRSTSCRRRSADRPPKVCAVGQQWPRLLRVLS